MTTKETLEQFMETRFLHRYLFMYKDIQLLKDGKYVEFAREQLKKLKYTLLFIFVWILYGSWFGIFGLISFGGNTELYELIIGIAAWVITIVGIIYVIREYYIVKSSMELFINLFDNEDSHDMILQP